MSIPKKLDQLSRKLRQIEQNHTDGTLSSAKLAVLRMIKHHNPVTLKELALMQKVALPTMSKIVDELQKRNLVIRALSKEDARKRWIVPTQNGIQKLQMTENASETYWQGKLGALNDKQQQQLSESLDSLINVL